MQSMHHFVRTKVQPLLQRSHCRSTGNTAERNQQISSNKGPRQNKIYSEPAKGILLLQKFNSNQNNNNQRVNLKDWMQAMQHFVPTKVQPLIESTAEVQHYRISSNKYPRQKQHNLLRVSQRKTFDYSNNSIAIRTTTCKG